jgi:hypothetical protein
LEVVRLPLSELKELPGNARTHDERNLIAIKASLERFGQVEPLIVQRGTNYVVGGNGRLQAMRELGWEFASCTVQDLSEEETRALALALNRTAELAGWDVETLGHTLQFLRERDWELPILGWEEPDLPPLPEHSGLPPLDGGMVGPVEPTLDAPDESPESQLLRERFIVPPFSVLDARQGYWQSRKREWCDLGIHGGEGRGEEVKDETCASGWVARGAEGAGGSVFDPVLCELAYRWFNVPGGHVLDPFGGEVTKGAVAGWLGYPYTGIELREEQVEENHRQWSTLVAGEEEGKAAPKWLCGDSAKLESLLPKGEKYDLIFTNPPYYDLEVYSKEAEDGSAFASYGEFMRWYTRIFQAAVKRLRDNRFLVVKVGEVRDGCGAYYNFVGDNLRVFANVCGLAYYNEAILVTPVGSLPIRTARQFPQSRKLGKGHQNVLVFYKGDPASVRRTFPEEIEVGHVDGSSEAAPGDGDPDTREGD